MDRFLFDSLSLFLFVVSLDASQAIDYFVGLSGG